MPTATIHTLIVEDDQLLNKLLSAALLRAGFNVTSLLSGIDAVNYFEAGKSPDIVLLDLMLPGLNGDEVLEKIRTSQSTATLPVIVLSNSADEDMRHRVIQLGVQGYFIKANCDLKQLLSLIADIVARFRH